MNKLLYILITLLLMSCVTHHRTKYERIENYVEKHSTQFSSLSKYDAIVIINDKGSCINCNNAFSKFIEKQVQNPNLLFIVSQNGTKVDISNYLNIKKSNLILDRKEEFSKMNIMNGSGILYLKGGKIIDSIIVNYKNIENILLGNQLLIK